MLPDSSLLPWFTDVVVHIWYMTCRPRPPRGVVTGGQADAMAQRSVRGYDCAVISAVETLLEQALLLPVEDRALLASGLLASLDSETLEEAEVERLWSAETERRALQLESGDAEHVAWEHVLERVNERRSQH